MPTPRPAIPFGSCPWCGSPDHAPVDCPTAGSFLVGLPGASVEEQVRDERRAHGGGLRITMPGTIDGGTC